ARLVSESAILPCLQPGHRPADYQHDRGSDCKAPPCIRNTRYICASLRFWLELIMQQFDMRSVQTLAQRRPQCIRVKRCKAITVEFQRVPKRFKLLARQRQGLVSLDNQQLGLAQHPQRRTVAQQVCINAGVLDAQAELLELRQQGYQSGAVTDQRRVMTVGQGANTEPQALRVTNQLFFKQVRKHLVE